MTLDEIRSMMQYVARTRRPPHAIDDLLSEWAVCLWDISREDAHSALMAVIRQHPFWPRPQDIKKAADQSVIVESEELTAMREEIERRRQQEADEEEAVLSAMRRISAAWSGVTRETYPGDAAHAEACTRVIDATRDDQELLDSHVAHTRETDRLEHQAYWDAWGIAHRAAVRIYMEARWREIEPHAKRLGIKKPI